MRLFRRLMPALLLALVAAPLAAQQVRGRVVDDAGGSVRAATVVLQDIDGQRLAATRTDSLGLFELPIPREGTYRLRAERIGYGQATTEAMQVGGRISLELTLRLSVRAVALDPLTITAQPDALRDARLVQVGFYDRQEQGGGYFFEREDIRRQRPVQMSVLVSQVPGVVVSTGGSFAAGDVVMVRGTHCLPSVWLDGRLARAGVRLERGDDWGRPTAEPRHSPFSRRPPPAPGSHSPAMDDLVTPEEVDAVEVYRGAAEVPAVFGFTGGGCGAVVVWTQFHGGLAATTR